MKNLFLFFILSLNACDYTANTQSQSIGSPSEECSLPTTIDLNRFGADDFSTGKIKWEQNSLYLLDSRGDLYKLLSESINECRLEIEPSFGLDGVLDASEPLEDFDFDQRSNLYARTSFSKIIRFQNNQELYNCLVPGTGISVSDDGFSAWSIQSGQLTEIRFSNSSCNETSPSFATSGFPILNLTSSSFGLLIQEDLGQQNLEFTLESSMGNTPLSGGILSSSSCSIDFASTCGNNLCLVSSNCLEVDQYSSSGFFLGSFSLENKFPSGNWNFISMTEFRLGSFYLSASLEGSREVKVFRIDGLL